jgi:hypothetical protein
VVGAGHLQEGHWSWIASHACYFSLAILSEVAMFVLFLCFSIFQDFRLFIVYIHISDKGHCQSSVYFLLSRNDVGIVEPGEFVEASWL